MAKLIDAIKNQTKQKSRSEKEEEIKTAIIDSKYERHLLAKAKISKALSLDLKVLPENYFENIDMQYIRSKNDFKQSLPFITPALTKLVPLYYPNLILVGALTGSGNTNNISEVLDLIKLAAVSDKVKIIKEL